MLATEYFFTIVWAAILVVDAAWVGRAVHKCIGVLEGVLAMMVVLAGMLFLERPDPPHLVVMLIWGMQTLGFLFASMHSAFGSVDQWRFGVREQLRWAVFGAAFVFLLSTSLIAHALPHRPATIFNFFLAWIESVHPTLGLAGIM